MNIRHVSGGTSTIATKTYVQEREAWQGATLELLWFDEESRPELYSEGLTRLTGDGIAFTTFTPLKGRTALVERFYHDSDPAALAARGVVRMSLDEAEHFSDAEKAAKLAGYQPHERDARRYGEPMLGEGSVYTTPTDALRIDQNAPIPLEWAKIWGIDFGSSVFAAVLLAWDRDRDVAHVIETVRLENSRPVEHAEAIRRICPDAPLAWPHDGHSHERGTGETIVSQYRSRGLKMLPTHATHTTGGYLVEPGILDIQQRMAEGRFRVRAHLVDWFEEYRGYHRKDGRIAKQRDHLMDATRMGVMMLRSARAVPIGDGSNIVPFRRRELPKRARGVDFDVFRTSNRIAGWRP